MEITDMAKVREYFCKTSGEMRYEAYVHLRSEANSLVRVQKYQKCKTKAEAEKVLKNLIRLAAQELRDEENRGSLWEVVVFKWESEAKRLMRNPTTLKPISEKSINGTVGMLNLWTKDWLKKPSKELSIKDGKDLLLNATSEDLRPASIRKIKTYVNLVFRYGVQEGIIEGVKHSPVHGVMFDLSDNDSLPEILSLPEAKKLLLEAKVRNHPWYPIWATALMTGMRSSELYALKKKNVLLDESIVRITESWDWESNCSKETKARYWRNAPIASALGPIFEECLSQNPDSPYLLPRIKEWEHGEQAQVLRDFCALIGIPSIRFHTLRACFATHLLAMGVEAGTIMAIGGWTNFKTFRIYIRLAGVTERHKTEDLANILVPNENSILERISKTYVAA
jgi:integrase